MNVLRYNVLRYNEPLLLALSPLPFLRERGCLVDVWLMYD